MPNANRNRGDYLERSTKAALEAGGWWAIRAAGSLGEADVVAMRNGMATLLIACKTNGKLPPAERAALIAASTRAGARPLMATRSKRGYVDLALVLHDGVRPYGAPLKVPPRTTTNPCPECGPTVHEGGPGKCECECHDD